jgi:AbrB family looped-hinge helix DNA binding protein
LKKQVRITRKGQITVPREIRLALGVRSGDYLLFVDLDGEVSVRPVCTKSHFAKYRGVGHGSKVSGRKAIMRRVRELRVS